jgi:hypothetical protein
MLASFLKMTQVSTKVQLSYNLPTSSIFKKCPTQNLLGLVLGF